MPKLHHHFARNSRIQFAGSVIFRALPFSVPKNYVKYIHAAIHGSVCIGIGIGLTTAIRLHDEQKIPQPHFYSYHSWIGIAAVAIYYIQVSCYSISSCLLTFNT